MRRRGKTPRQGRAGPGQPHMRGAEGARSQRGSARGSRRLGRQTKGCRGPGAVRATRSRRGAAGQALSPQPDARVPCHRLVPGPRSSSTCCRAHMPRSANHPPARGSRRPARPPRPPCPHLLIGRGEVLSDHGTGPLRLTRDHDAVRGASSKKCPLH